MSLIDKIPEMTDAEVAALLTNARRLQTAGNDGQRAAANDLLPMLEQAAAERRTTRLAAAQTKREATRRTKNGAA